jgi:DNA replication protein DnaC
MTPMCENCGGTGFVYVERNGVTFAQPCACRARAPVTGEDAFLKLTRIPPRYQHCSFANVEAFTAPLASALEKCLLYCSGYPHSGVTDQGLGLLMSGDNGVGKTHLAVAVLRELMQNSGARGQFWDFHALLREIRNSYNPETRTTELQVLEPVVEADILLLDDLGAWRMTDWMVDTLFYILNSRYMAKRPTLITTNFQDVSAEEAARKDPNERKEFLVERVGQRVRSRIMEMCLVIRMNGQDYRQVRQTSNQELLLRRS